MPDHKGFDINTVDTPKPWGAREEQAWRDVIDTLVGDTFDSLGAHAKDVGGHKHHSVYDTEGAKVIQSADGKVGIGGLPDSTATLKITGDAVVTGLTALHIVETDSSNKLISAVKLGAYNKAFGTTAGTVSEGNHLHVGYEPAFGAGTETQYLRGDKTWQFLYNNQAGTVGRVPYWYESGALSAGAIRDDGTRVGIGCDVASGANIPLLVQRNSECAIQVSCTTNIGGNSSILYATAYDADGSSNASYASLDVFVNTATSNTYFGVNCAGGTFLRLTPRGLRAVIGTTNASDLVIGTSNAERMRIYANGTGKFIGKFGIGGEPDSTAMLKVTNSGSIAEALILSQNTAGTINDSRLSLYTVRGAEASPETTHNGDYLGTIAFQGYSGTGRSDGALIRAHATALWSGSSSDSPTDLSFWTCPDGAGIPLKRLTISNGGDVYTDEWQDYFASVRGWNNFQIKIIRYKKIGKLVFVNYSLKGEGNSEETTFSLPFTASSTMSFATKVGAAGDNVLGVVDYLGAGVLFPESSLWARVRTDTLWNIATGSVYGNGGDKWLCGQFWYEAA